MNKENKSISCFVIMPIGDEEKDPEKFQYYKNVYEDLIKKSVENISQDLNCNILCSRADNIRKSGSIMKQVLQGLNDQDIVIADLSNGNPNVFYELGIRHALFKRTILVSDAPRDNPFDIHGYRTIPYKFPLCNIGDFEDNLREHIKEIIAHPTKSDNPVWDLNLKNKIDDQASVEVKVGYKDVVIASDRHEYEFEFGVKNKGESAYKELIAEISFPEEYLEKNNWGYPHLSSNIVHENEAQYVHFTFRYLGLREELRKQKYDVCLLPDHILWIFGKESPLQITRVLYCVMRKNWGNRMKYRVSWKVFIDGREVINGSMPFKTLQKF